MDQWTVSIESVTQVGPAAVAIQLETPAGFDALPGQFVLIRATIDGEDYARHYTLSSPAVTETFELTVGIGGDGAFSTWLADRQPGDSLTIEGPFGRIAYGGDGPVRVIAGGPGLGAGLGVAERAVSAGHEVSIVADPGETGLIHERRFGALAAAHPIYIVSTADGFENAIANAYAEVSAGTTYVFGFQAFVDRTRAAIEAAGGDPSTAEIESYG